MSDVLEIKQIRSAISCCPRHKATLLGLGLKKIGHSVTRHNTCSIQGMINKISYMLEVKEL